jgi:hypothetical protein
MRISSSAPRRELKFLRTWLGRVIRDIRRKIEGDPALEDRSGPPLDLALRVRHQEQRQRGLKVYSLYAYSATIWMGSRIASWRNVPEDAIVASFILLPEDGRSVRGRPVVERPGLRRTER